MTTPPELAALEAELARLRPAEATFDTETILDRASSRRVGRKTRPGLAARFAWVATGFVAGAVFMAVGPSIWGSFNWNSPPTAEVTRIDQIRVPAVPGDVEEALAAHFTPASHDTDTEEEASQEPAFPLSRYAVLSRGDLDLDRLDEYLDRMSALAKRMESAADQWHRSRPYYWSQTARDASREKSVKSWDEYRALIDSAEAGELLSL